MLGSLQKLSLVALALTALLIGCASPAKKNPTDPAEQISMGEKYSTGTWQVSKNDEKAALWYRKAALQGDPEGEYRLGLCYEAGMGVPKSEALALKWFSSAAKEGNSGAQFEMGNCYRLARGVGIDLTKAYFWFNLSAASGNPDARDERDALARRMTEEQIRQAQRQSEEFWGNLDKTKE
jgi:TPR repeat protein